jgi:trehalose 6-phosphate phosphatase
VEHLLSSWLSFSQKFKLAKHLLLLTDYDGTLTPIVARPELANLTVSMRLLLQELQQMHNVTLGIISGRALDDIRNKIGINGIIYAGNHGLEIEGPGIRFINPLAEEIKPAIAIIRYLLHRTFGTTRGVLVEDKGLTLSVHYRLAETNQTENVKSKLESVMEQADTLGHLKVTSGKKVFEVRPGIEWDKGKAIQLLMRKYGKTEKYSDLISIFLGDDITDEDGFKVIEESRNGISIFVGEANGDSSAPYYLKSPAEVEIFLSRMLELMGQSSI